MQEARKNDEVISLGDSQVLRFIDEINGVDDTDVIAKQIKSEIKIIKKRENSIQNKREIRSLYNKLDEVLFKKDYMCLVVEKKSDYKRACKGFRINGNKYVRLLGTNGGVKLKTIVFVSESVVDELRYRIDNGRDLTKPIVPAKLEAYKALVCSGSIPVSYPSGILLVDDCKTKFMDTTIHISNDQDGEPLLEENVYEEICLAESDGYGLMLPSIADRWSVELGLDHTVSGVNTRCSFEKGMLFTFDFIDFADKISGGYIVQDVYGNDVDIRNVEIILTTSMLKLWDSYSSIEDYINNCKKNGYTFSISKTAPKELESERGLNYQFIQSIDFKSEEEINDLIRPTVDEILDILGGDYRKALLFLRGINMNDSSVIYSDPDFIKAIMICPDIIKDPFVISKIYSLIRNRIDEAKVGVLKVHGNYSIVSGDPYALCQHIFGLPITGLLGAGELYNKYWADRKAEKLACFRAPMTCENNIRVFKVAQLDSCDYWYRHIKSCTIINAWDNSCSALNGMD